MKKNLLNHQKVSKYYEHDCTTSTTGINKVIENSNLTPRKNQHQSDNIFGPYVDLQKAHVSRATVINLLQILGFITNIRKSILLPCQKIEFWKWR